jgi:Tfp pilus assembly protein PilF
MRISLTTAALAGFLFQLSLSAQVSGRGIASMGDTPKMTSPESGHGDIFLSGKVVLDDGMPLTDSAAIQTVCDGEKRTETYTDRQGIFSFKFGDARSSGRTGLGDAGLNTNNQTSGQFLYNLRDCELQAVLPGFASETIVLSSRITNFESTDLGKLKMHRLSHVEGLTVSSTSASAPAAAKKALERAHDREIKAKWNEAQELLEKAVVIYPKYAVAWFELGRVQVQQNNLAGARQSFTEALKADPKYVNPYDGLAQLAAQEQNWQELVLQTERVLQLNPVSFPDVWFFNAVGHYYLQQWDAAEKSARQGLELDAEHRIPKLEYLLGMALMNKRDYVQAAEHMRRYLSLTKIPSEVAEGQRQLSEMIKLSPPTSAQEK